MGKILYVRVLRKDLQNPSKPKKTYAQSQSRAEMDINEIAAHMVGHGSSFSRGTIAAVLSDVVDHVRELIQDGNIVRLGDLGTFNVTLESTGVVESQMDMKTGKKPVFTAKNITAVNCRFTPGKYLENLIEGVEFEETMSRQTQSIDLATKSQMMADGTWGGDKGINNMYQAAVDKTKPAGD